MEVLSKDLLPEDIKLNILNELLQYQIDTDITKNLEIIVANIDDILKA